MINECPACDDFHIGSAYRDAASRTAWGNCIAELLYHVIGYMGLYDREYGIPRHTITSE